MTHSTSGMIPPTNNDGGGNNNDSHDNNNYRLAPEIVTDIFLKIADYKTREELDSCRVEASSIIACSQTCQPWRAVALGTPKLWAQLSQAQQDSSQRFKEIMSRCDWSPISIVSGPLLHYPSDKRAIEISEHWDLIFKHFSSVQNFFVRVGKVTLWNEELFKRVIISPVPSLQSFTVLHNSPEVSEGTLIEHGIVPFRGFAPRLDTLQLRGKCALPFAVSLPLAFPLSSLKHLTIQHTGTQSVQEDRQFALKPSSWIDLLCNTPSLSTLVVYNAIFDSPSGLFPVANSSGQPDKADAIDVCVLPHLEDLKFFGHAGACTVLFNSISFPSSCNVSLTYTLAPRRDPINHEDVFLSLARCLTRLDLHGTALTLRTRGAVQILVQDGGRWSFNFHFECAQLVMSDSDLQKFLAAVALLDTHHTAFLRSLQAVTLNIDTECENFNSRALLSYPQHALFSRSLHVPFNAPECQNPNSESPVHLLRPLFLHFVSVSELHLHGLCNEVLTYFYSHFQQPSADTSNPTGRCAFPHLKEVVIFAPKAVELETVTRPSNQSRLVKLCNALKLRSANSSHPASRLRTVVIVTREDDPWDPPMPDDIRGEAIHSKSRYSHFNDPDIAEEVVFRFYHEVYGEVEQIGGRGLKSKPAGISMPGEVWIDNIDECTLRK